VVLAVIADTHMPRGPRRIPEACLERLEAAEAILHAGDFLELEVLEAIQALGPPVYAVRGNGDSSQLQARLPLMRTVKAGGATIGMVHDAGPATGRLNRMRRRFPDADAVVFGHSHIPLHETSDDGFQIFNPGSPTERRRQPHHTMGTATIKDGKISFDLTVLV
jgi:putative phosphoesterase